MADREVKEWITVNGMHIPIYDGESKDDAVNRVQNNLDKVIGRDEHKVIKDASKIAMLKKQYNMSDKDIEEQLKNHNGNVDRLEKTLTSVSKTASKYSQKQSSERVGKQSLADAPIGARLEDSNGDVWRKTNSGNNGMLPWHKEYSTDKASNDYLAQSKDIKSSKFITPAKKGEDFPYGKAYSKRKSGA